MTLNPEQQKLINEMVKSGLYESPDAAIDAAIRLLDERSRKLEALRQDIQEGLDSGPGRPFDEFLAEEIKLRGRERLAQRPNPS